MFIGFTFYSCKSSQDVVLTLAEIKPLPKEVVIEKKLEYEPIYTNLKILEVSEVNGIQKYIIAKNDTESGVLEVGMIGEIAIDNNFSEIIGTGKISSLRSGFLECEIENTTHKVPINSYIRFQIGKKAKE